MTAAASNCREDKPMSRKECLRQARIDLDEGLHLNSLAEMRQAIIKAKRHITAVISSLEQPKPEV